MRATLEKSTCVSLYDERLAIHRMSTGSFAHVSHGYRRNAHSKQLQQFKIRDRSERFLSIRRPSTVVIQAWRIL